MLPEFCAHQILRSLSYISNFLLAFRLSFEVIFASLHPSNKVIVRRCGLIEVGNGRERLMVMAIGWGK